MNTFDAVTPLQRVVLFRWVHYVPDHIDAHTARNAHATLWIGAGPSNTVWLALHDELRAAEILFPYQARYTHASPLL